MSDHPIKAAMLGASLSYIFSAAVTLIAVFKLAAGFGMVSRGPAQTS